MKNPIRGSVSGSLDTPKVQSSGFSAGAANEVAVAQSLIG